MIQHPGINQQLGVWTSFYEKKLEVRHLAPFIANQDKDFFLLIFVKESIAQEYLRTCEDLLFSKTSGGGGANFFHDCVKFIAIYHCVNAG